MDYTIPTALSWSRAEGSATQIQITGGTISTFFLSRMITCAAGGTNSSNVSCMALSRFADNCSRLQMRPYGPFIREFKPRTRYLLLGSPTARSRRW
ncbi:hypothetical protein K469DRAFT_3398 [Zopfia rhizophila CBS 207.26]|uniref:Uncharacterized protein n=1 Tax=Zopfia rhizophila CBS 207.26 TaxID=1314779 RepID=A0A6A6EVQ7_9PEZI|nr:hypothetical protein K469DRAFT_3398 [Zopfia rhizophila CBS 207.26]